MLRRAAVVVGVTALAGGAACLDGGAPPPATRWAPLVTVPWSLAPGTQDPAVHATVTPDDLAIGGLRILAPPGTHDVRVTVDDPGLTAASFLFAAVVGDPPVEFPPGVALRLPAGHALDLELHVFNVTDAPLAGTSGVEARLLDPAEVTAEVGVVIVGGRTVSVPPGISTATSSCTVTAAMTVLGVYPYLRQHGRRATVTVTTGGADHVLYDQPYDTDHQGLVAVAPLAVAPGDTITTTCVWDNSTATTLGYGEGPDGEVCHALVLAAPVVGRTWCER